MSPKSVETNSAVIESEVIIQARERGVPTVLIDDRKGKTVAEQHSLKVYDLLDLLLIFNRNGIIDDIKSSLQSLERKYKPKKSRLREILTEADEI